MKYIATFYSHFGAIRFNKQCKSLGHTATLMPVPRDLSSSCGTCVSLEADSFELEPFMSEELEQVVACKEDGYQEIFRAENS